MVCLKWICLPVEHHKLRLRLYWCPVLGVYAGLKLRTSTAPNTTQPAARGVSSCVMAQRVPRN